MLWSVAEAKSRFSELIKLVQTGEPVMITNHGNPVARVLPPTMANVLAERLRQLREWLGEASISRMAEALGLPKAGDLGRFYDGTDEPTFEFMETLAKRFRFNPDWLKHGASPEFPWERISCGFYSHEAVIDHLERLKPKEIFFVRVNHQGREQDKDFGEAGLVLKWDDLTYQAFGQYLHVSDHVGGTGTTQLWALSRLTIELPKHSQWSITGKVLPADLFHSIFKGEKWAGLVERGFYSTWWDDLADFNHERTAVAGEKGEAYARHYGESFLKAQNVLRSYIKWREYEAIAAKEASTSRQEG